MSLRVLHPAEPLVLDSQQLSPIRVAADDLLRIVERRPPVGGLRVPPNISCVGVERVRRALSLAVRNAQGEVCAELVEHVLLELIERQSVRPGLGQDDHQGALRGFIRVRYSFHLPIGVGERSGILKRVLDG